MDRFTAFISRARSCVAATAGGFSQCLATRARTFVLGLAVVLACGGTDKLAHAQDAAASGRPDPRNWAFRPGTIGTIRVIGQRCVAIFGIEGEPTYFGYTYRAGQGWMESSLVNATAAAPPMDAVPSTPDRPATRYPLRLGDAVEIYDTFVQGLSPPSRELVGRGWVITACGTEGGTDRCSLHDHVIVGPVQSAEVPPPPRQAAPAAIRARYLTAAYERPDSAVIVRSVTLDAVLGIHYLQVESYGQQADRIFAPDRPTRDSTVLWNTRPTVILHAGDTTIISSTYTSESHPFVRLLRVRPGSPTEEYEVPGRPRY